MRVIIAGGTGMIGKALTQELLSHGHEVIILSRSPKKAADLAQGLQYALWDGNTAQGWGHLVEEVDAIVNLAGENLAGEHFFPTRWTATRKQSLIRSRLQPAAAILDALHEAEQKPDVLVQASAVGYYGPLGDQPVDESHPPAEDFLADLCKSWEASTAEVEDLGVRRVITRGGVVLSTAGGALTRLLLPFKLFAGGPLGNGKQYYSWIHMDDHVGAMRFLIENPTAQGVYNFTAPQPVTNREFARVLGRVMRRPSFIPLPAFVFWLLFGEVSTVVVEGQRVLPTRLQQAGYPFKFGTLEPALRDLLNK